MKCSLCGKEMTAYDIQEGRFFNDRIGYGSKHDGDHLRLCWCTSCFDDIIWFTRNNRDKSAPDCIYDGDKLGPRLCSPEVQKVLDLQLEIRYHHMMARRGEQVLIGEMRTMVGAVETSPGVWVSKELAENMHTAKVTQYPSGGLHAFD